jgi:hypothetical protein
MKERLEAILRASILIEAAMGCGAIRGRTTLTIILRPPSNDPGRV